MSKAYLKTYLEQIRTTYDEARAAYIDLSDQLEAENKSYEKIQYSHDYTASGKKKAREQHEEKAGKLLNQIRAVGIDAADTFTEITKTADNIFGDLYRVTPEKLDMAALELLKSGLLTSDELVELAGKYSDNRTMIRYFAKYAREKLEKEPDNTSLKQLVGADKDRSIPHMEALETLSMWANKSLRPERHLADAVAREFDQHADQIIAEYGDISTEV